MPASLSPRQIRWTVVVVAASSLAYLTSEHFHGPGCLCVSTSTAAQLVVEKFLPESIRLFRADVGRLPTVHEGLRALVHPPQGAGARWKGPYLEGGRIPVDPWAREFRYRPLGKSGFEIYSVGPDGVISADDIIFVEMPNA